ncbi:TonB-dependent receptor domain-containing protein [Fretibacter rubidus]|uniref:TonB-dependent receptor domain-containing protein n=1 Tax=Fretibacter rubidus TaxID=570162 RepID=UPI00352AFAAD
MEKLDFKKLLLGTSLLVGFSAFAATPTFAQDTTIDGEDLTVQTVEEEEEELSGGEVVVTGSRIKRDTFSSLSPLQVIDFDEKRDLGIIDPVTILQTTESAAGQQIDATFSGFVLDNGPGSETINIRGLGANRTLVLINGRRIAPAGVEGAPSVPSINLIPGSLVDRTDILLEGASSVYGSDAVAGVVNVLLKKDFEGFDVTATYNPAQDSGGQDYNLAGSWGKNFDRGFIGVGAEYDFRDAIKLVDRDYLGGCDRHYEVDENGDIRTLGIGDEVVFNEWYGGSIQAAPSSECKTGTIAGRIFERGGTFGSIYYNPGESNIGIPNFVDQNLIVPVDADGDGVQDYGFPEFSLNGADPNEDLLPEQKRINLMAYGEYTLEGDANLTPFFEVIYSRAETFIDSGTFGLGVEVGADNPFNPCGTNGSDCGSSNFNFDDAFQDRWNTYYRDRDPNRDGDNRDARVCSTIGATRGADGQFIFPDTPGFFDGARCTPFAFGYGPGDTVGPQQVRPIVGVDGDRTLTDLTIENTRLVGGFRGDLPFMNFGEFSDWSFEASLTHSISNGVSSRPGIREDRLYYALGNDLVSGQPIAGLAPCTAAPGVTVRADVVAGCVPVNMFAPSLFNLTNGDFGTQAERNYLFDDRTFDTEYKQTVWSGFVSGTVAEVPAGKINAVVGLEYQSDQISSTPNEVASDGLLIGFFSDSGAQGKKFVRSAYAEVDIPLVAAQPFFEELEVNLSGRILEDEFYGGASTYSAKVGWRPFESLLLKASYGTSFRSPNLRENFLEPQTGFLTLFDPCVVPADAFGPNLLDPNGPDIYDPTLDGREETTIARCQAEGLDPFTLNAGGGSNFSTEVAATGSLDLDPEESTSFTAGFSFDQPFTDAFDLEFGASYYDIQVENSVIRPSAQFIINDCYVNERDSRSPFCDRIGRDANNLLDTVNQGFINLNEDQVRGIDFNARLGKEFTMFERNFEYDANIRANHILEVRSLFIGDDGTPSEDNNEGEFGFAEWTGNLTQRLTYDDFSFTWGTRYVGAVEQDIDGVDTFANAFGVDIDDNGTPDVFSDTCGGPAVGDVNCRDVGFAGDYFVHNAGISYNDDDQDWGITLAMSNVFDRNPPKADSSEVTTAGNAVIGRGYDFEGRKFFVQLRKGF